MRPEALREATRKAAGERQRKLRKRLSKGEKTSTRRMATVASVYTIEAFYRTPEDIVRDLDADKREAVCRFGPSTNGCGPAWLKSRPRSSRRCSRRPMAEPEHRKESIVLVDGNETQLRLIKETAAKRGAKVTIELDVIHVIEYLWRAAYCFHADGTSDAEDWVTEHLLEVLRGDSSDVAAGIGEAPRCGASSATGARLPMSAPTTSSSTAPTSTTTSRWPPGSPSRPA